jgi:hypothetical protein
MMERKRRPIELVGVACLFILVGAVGLVHHFPNLHAIQKDDVWIELTEIVAIVAGVSLLRGQNWARWLAIAWMALHVAISFPVLRQVVFHTVIFAAIAWILFRPTSQRYFARNLSQ